MKLKKYSLLPAVLLALAAFTTSCRKEMPDLNQPERYINSSFDDQFEAFWNGMNNNYIFWDIDATNWDNVYRKYKPLFAKMNLYDSNDVRKSYTYFKEMTAGLSDSHYSLSFRSPYLADSAMISPAVDRVMKRPDYHPPISLGHFYNRLPVKYLDPGYKRGLVYTADGGYIAVTGTIKNDILYFYFSGFALEALYNNEPNPVKTVIQEFFDLLKTKQNIKGLIIDVRGNPGGYLNDLKFLFSKLVTQPLHFAYTRGKSGNGRLDYTPWIPAIVTPAKDAREIKGPVIALGDIHSVSMAELTTMAVKAMPNGKFIGERTWGGNGPLIGNNFYNGGQFSTAFISSVYTSSLMLKYIDGNVYEGKGFPPDIEVKYDKPALDAGNDLQLERAISTIPQ